MKHYTTPSIRVKELEFERNLLASALQDMDDNVIYSEELEGDN